MVTSHSDSMKIVEWILEQTQTIMEALGEPARIIPRKTIRGGVSVETVNKHVPPSLLKCLPVKSLRPLHE